MARTATESVCIRRASTTGSTMASSSCSVAKCSAPFGLPTRWNLQPSRIRASSQSQDVKNKFYKELGMFSLRRKIEDSVLRAEMLAPTALEFEEARKIKQEEVIRESNLWDDLAKSNEILVKLADSSKVVDALKDLKYKAEEARLITELAEMNAVDYELFKQAYSASMDVNKILTKYEMSKLLKEPYDKEGACITINAGNEGVYSEIWAEQLAKMYMKWSEKQGHAGRIVEKSASENGGLKSTTIEFEFKFAYGYLSGERGIHHMITTQRESFGTEAVVDVIPLFLDSAPELQIDEKELVISFPSCSKEDQGRNCPSVHIQHIPTGLRVQSTGERSRFANKTKAINRLKAKLLTILRQQGLSSVTDINRDSIVDMYKQERLEYHPTTPDHTAMNCLQPQLTIMNCHLPYQFSDRCFPQLNLQFLCKFNVFYFCLQDVCLNPLTEPPSLCLLTTVLQKTQEFISARRIQPMVF